MPRIDSNVEDAVRWIDAMLESYGPGIAIAPETVVRLKQRWELVKKDYSRRIDDGK